MLASKLRALKKILKDWNRVQVGDVHSRVSVSRAVLDAIQSEISVLGPSEERFTREDAAHAKYLFDLSLQSTLLRDKSRVRWLDDGDRNSSFFHNMVKIRRLNKTISSLSVGNSVLHGQAAIATHFVQHFEQSFARNENIIDTGLVGRVIPSLVTAEENNSLTIIPTSQEVFAAVRAMDGFSAPGPDGFGGCFFSHCWEVVGPDVTLAVQSFFGNGFILPKFNSNLLILIPKGQDSEGVSDFHPIALANFVFKVIIKILADRLGLVASRIVSLIKVPLSKVAILLTPLFSRLNV